MKDSGNTTVAKKMFVFFSSDIKSIFPIKLLSSFIYVVTFIVSIWSYDQWSIKKNPQPIIMMVIKKNLNFFFYWSLLLSSFWQFVAIPQFSIYWIFKNFQFSISTCYTDTHTLIIIYWSKLIVCFLFSVSEKKEFFHSHFSTNKQNLKKNCLERKSFYLFNTEN